VRRSETDEHKLAKLMIGQDIEPESRPADPDYASAPVVLELKDVRLQEKDEVPLLDGLSFSVCAGEIFGIAGVSGNGQDVLCELLAGTRKATSGQVLFEGRDVSAATIRERIALGVGYVPVDRYRDGMVMDMTLAENMLLKSSFGGKWTKRGLIDHRALADYTAKKIGEHRVKATGPNDLARSLSGGNQQKVVLAREVDLGTKLLVLNQPTRGLDMGAVDRIHRVILQEREAGKAVLLVSTELSEIFELCNRVAVMYKGRFMGIYPNGALTSAQIGLLMAGIPEEEAKQA
jgi:simple sugar transport system ATP-binding protein